MNREVVVKKAPEDFISRASKLVSEDLKAPRPILIIENKEDDVLSVLTNCNSLIISSEKEEEIINVNTEKFRALMFIGCRNCRVYIGTKILKLSFFDCENLQVSIKKGIISLTELMRCEKIKVRVNIDNVTSDFPIFTVELSNDVYFYQYISDIVYIIVSSSEVVTTLTSKREVYNIEDLFGSRRFFHLSRKNGMNYVDTEWKLRFRAFERTELLLSMSEMLPEEDENDENIELFGTTPPTVSQYLEAMTTLDMQFSYKSNSHSNSEIGGCGFKN